MNIMLNVPETHTAGVAALGRLIEVVTTHGGTGQAEAVRRFLLGLYNGQTFAFDLTDLRLLDGSIQEDCLRVVAMDMDPRAEVHKRIPGTSEVIADWAVDAWPETS